MPRYIDAEKLEKDGWSASRIYQQDAKTMVYETKKMTDFPTADVVEVVRCKECFYAIPYNEKWTLPKKNNCMWCKRYEDIRTPDWFCADGERREPDE